MDEVGGSPVRGADILTFDIEAAHRAVDGVVLRTPLLSCPELEAACGRRVLLKLESLQRTGSFKVRGALARIAALTAAERSAGVVACSSGNHGRAMAWAAAHAGVPASVYVPEWVDPVKLAGIRASGAEAVVAGDTFDDAEARAVADAAASGRVYVSAYDDPWVIAGQATVGLEVVETLGRDVGAVVVPLSGGGLAGGVALGLRHRLGGAAPPVVAVAAERAAVMHASVRAGRPVSLPEEPTLAGALAGGIGENNRFSFVLVRDTIDQHVIVTEHEIANAIRFCYNELSIVVEGGGAVGVAALLHRSEGVRPVGEGPLVVVVSGGNIANDTLASVLTEQD